jgi:hypothetical protein
VIVGVDPYPAKVGDHTTITVKVRDDCGIMEVQLVWGYVDEAPWLRGTMDGDGSVYSKDIPWTISGLPDEGFPRVGTVIWWIQADDCYGNRGSTEQMHIPVEK